jgi:hypothetical protein
MAEPGIRALVPTSMERNVQDLFRRDPRISAGTGFVEGFVKGNVEPILAILVMAAIRGQDGTFCNSDTRPASMAEVS